MKKLLVMIAMMLPLTVMAQEEKDATATIPQSESTFLVAAELSKYGYANKDALSLIQAARLSKQAGFTQQDQLKAGTGGQPSADAASKSGEITLDPTKLLADAKTMANGDRILLALINDVDNNVRGAVGGSKYHVDRVLAHDYDLYEISFRANELATVTVVGDGDTDLDLYVYDQNGNLIDKDDDYTDNCICTWTPRWTGVFRIKIVNRGSVYNRYVLRTN